ncbi:putative membrane associated protein [Cryptosporidium canis]|nr:putative membrane associated protein [Cryptosporidium canis]
MVSLNEHEQEEGGRSGVELEDFQRKQSTYLDGEKPSLDAEECVDEATVESLRDEQGEIRLNIGESASVKSNISSMEFIRQYADRKEGLFLAAEYLLLVSCISIGAYIVYQEDELTSYLQNKSGFEVTRDLINQAKIMTVFVTLVMGVRLLTNLTFGILFILFKRGIIVKWINVFKSKLFIDQVFIWQSPFISLPIIVIALVRLMVNCKSQLEEIRSLQRSSLDVEISNFSLHRLLFLIIYYSVYLLTNFIMEQLVVRRQYLGNVIQSQRLGILDYSIAYIGNAALVASLILYFFRFRYTDDAESNIDLRSQIEYYYKTILAAAAHSGLISVFLGILGYIASLSCSKMLILISLIVKFYSAFVFSWSCSLVWFGNQLLKLFCNIDSISQNLYSLPLQDYMAFKSACFTRPNFYLVTVLVIIQLSLSIFTLILNFLFLINKRIWKTEY